jgi:signal transduction histidine kinase
MRTRNWSIRSKIIALIAVPLAALLALWVFATTLTIGPALNLLSAQTVLDTVSNPGQVLVAELQRERKLSVEFLSAPDTSPAALAAQRVATDRSAADFRLSAGSTDAQEAAGGPLLGQVDQLVADLDALPSNRAHIDRREVDPIGAQGLYNAVLDTAFQMFAATATFNDESVDREVRALSTVGRGQEHLSRVDSLLGGANAEGQVSGDVRDQMIQVIGTSAFLLDEGVADLPEQDRTAYQRLYNGPALTTLRRLQQQLITESRAGAPSPVTGPTWQPVYDTAAQELRAFQLNANTALTERAKPVAYNVLIRLGVAGIVGLAALIISIVVSVKVGRSIVARLARLRAEAHEMADERLPTVVRRLQRGEAVDVNVETPPLEYGSDEIGQVGRAFNEVQRTAVQSAVEEANVRRGINEVFLNIARRSQTLLHRQLALLDRMERRETGPDELEDLYRVDHLATRMRRHAEDLVILAGAAPGRGWRNPVPIIDVVRGAISEVEDYKRIDIRSIDSSAVLGRAVGDVIHLLAELLENAASFSPPTTRVVVGGQVLPNGYALEIEDRGLGMSPEAIEEANRKLVEPPDFDPANSARLGLFVVAQLANRHSIRISLRSSAFGGVTAIVLIPADLIAPAGPMALPAGPSASGPSPSDRAWDRPLVGTGLDDPSRHSLAALQWQGTEQLRSVTVPGRPVSINGSTGSGPNAGPVIPHQRTRTNGPSPYGPAPSGPVPAGPAQIGPAPAEPAQTGPAPVGLEQTRLEQTGREQTGPMPGGPTPSAVADVTPDGLVQRRRTVPRRVPRQAGDLARPQDLAEAAAALAKAAPELPAPTRPVPGATSAVLDPSTPDGLPRRVRQASLAPQLRAPVEEDADTVPLRSPEQVRELMSALQRGTIRGRLAARGLAPDVSESSDADSSMNGTSGFAEAATVSFPVVQNRPEHHGDQQQGAEHQGGGVPTQQGDAGSSEPDGEVAGDHPAENHGTRPDKDT